MENYEAIRQALIKDIKIHHDLFESWTVNPSTEEHIRDIQQNKWILENIIGVIDHSRAWPDKRRTWTEEA